MNFHNEESKEAKFMEAIRDCYLYQHNKQDSQRRGNDELSLIFTDEEMQVSEVAHHAPLGKSCHDVITFKFNWDLDNSKLIDKFVYDKFEDLWHSLKSQL